MSAAVTAVDVVRGADSRAADSKRAGGDVILLQLKAFEYVGNVTWSCGWRSGEPGGRSHISSSAH